MLLDDGAQFGDDARHVDAAGLEVAAARVEHGFQLLDQEGHVAALAEYRAHDAREGHDPLEVVHVLGVDEDLERAAQLVFGAGVEHDVVDGDVQRVLEQRRLDLVGGADQRVGALDLLVHLDDFGHRHGRRALRRLRGGDELGGFFGLDDAVTLDLLADLHGLH